ncbi:hypothetical protein FRX31_014791 [Thalictrum thalictroides]|uniref:Uncharacterized protein n=1 Tax=Thalictrum thalictroides TaxID=46969 RepID=A0A7J6WDW8_THATH|nr:hypothetical protein FRX31_014791 [Thalictrum thalictroides]
MKPLISTIAVFLVEHEWRAVISSNLYLIQVVGVLNPLALDYKSIGTVKEELADLQEDLSQAHEQEVTLSSSHSLLIVRINICQTEA